MKRLRILWLSHFVPYPPKGGCFQRSYNLIKRVGADHDVHLVAVKHKSGDHPEDEIREARTELLRHCKSVQIVDISSTTTPAKLAVRALTSVLQAQPLSATIYRSAQLLASVRKIVAEAAIEAAHFDTIGLAQYLPEVGSIPTLMTHHGAESFMIQRRIRNERSLPRKLFFFLEWLTLRRYEARQCPKFANNVVMSSLDQEILAGIAPHAAFTVVPNGVDIEYFKLATPAPPGSRTVVFAGRLDQYSNRHGMLQFMQHAWPALAQAYPDVNIHVIGSNPPGEIKQLAERDTRVKVHGFVPDVRPYFDGAAAAICPIWDGGGTRIKVLDALAQGMPLVATSIGAEGIEVVPERDLLIADTPQDFVQQISRLFDQPELRQRLSANGRKLAEAVYSWDSIGRKLSGLYAAAYVPAATQSPGLIIQ
jgi:polysaccharide biosynthesis protein PslH